MSQYREQAEAAAANWEPFTQNHDPSYWRALRDAYAQGYAAALQHAKGEEDPFESPEYQRFVESMVPHCHCEGSHRPCGGVLAGGLCDGLREEAEAEEADDLAEERSMEPFA